MANVLNREKQETVVLCLMDGASVRATERITVVHRDTIIGLIHRDGTGSRAIVTPKCGTLNATSSRSMKWTFIVG